ncbi:YbaB/EbfC family nucleoid-associated protein [Bacteroidota bacterium]
MMDLFGKLKEVQTKMKEAQDKLAQIRVEGESGAGMVKAIVNGQKQLLELQIDDDLIKPEDKDMMKDLIVAAINKAMAEADIVAKEEVRKSAGGVLPNIPGLDLSGLV